MERYIAIDNVCAWPNLTLMPDKSIVAMIFNQPVHGRWEGDVECWASEDDGYTWRKRGVPAPHEPGTNRMNKAAGLAHDGSLVAAVAGWSDRPPKGEARGFENAERLDPWICRSADGGLTWQRGGSIVIQPDNPQGKVPFGDIIRLSDGKLGMSLKGGPKQISYFYCSEDDGYTWAPLSVIGAGNHSETALLALDNSRILAAVRTKCDEHVQLYISDDEGNSWTDRGHLSLGRQVPGHLLQLSDGRILLAYGIRDQRGHGIGTRMSEDRGETWCNPTILVDLEDHPPRADGIDCGYPSSVQTDDGTIVTAYYCSWVEQHNRYHMGVVRWHADELSFVYPKQPTDDRT